MSVFQALVLGIVQGATEFIPISSSAHLVLVPWLLGWPNPSLPFDTTLHLGTLVAVLGYFWRDWVDLGRAWMGSLGQRMSRSSSANPLSYPQARIAWLIILGTVPAALLGFLFEDFFAALFGAPPWVAVLLLVTGLILAGSEYVGRRQREMAELTWLDALLIGLAQGVAIAPGISRSGATISMGLFRGLRREAAAGYSFLLATPIIFGAGLLQLKELATANEALLQWPNLVVGFLAATVSGYLGIKFLLAYLQRGRLYIFAAYCWLVGLAALSIALL